MKRLPPLLVVVLGTALALVYLANPDPPRTAPGMAGRAAREPPPPPRGPDGPLQDDQTRREGRCSSRALEPDEESQEAQERPSLAELAPLAPLETWVDREALADVLAMVTPEGLFERTSGWWEQDDFLALTGDELAALVPEAGELGYAFGGGATLLEFVGGLPTLADCERGFASPEVARALERVVALELPINALGLTPLEERSAEWAASFDQLLAAQRASELDLARALESATGYAHWAILRRAFAAWNQ